MFSKQEKICLFSAYKLMYFKIFHVKLKFKTKTFNFCRRFSLKNEQILK